MKSLFVSKLEHNTASLRVSLGLLALRLLIGVAFILHGTGKIASPMTWMGPESSIPGIFQAFAALAEFAGGFALILGALTPLVSVSMILTMLGAIVFHLAKGDAFIGGYELATLYLVAVMVVLLTGPGRLSVDALIVKTKN